MEEIRPQTRQMQQPAEPAPDGDSRQKNPSHAFWLGFLFGPLGLLYADIQIGCAGIVLAIIMTPLLKSTGIFSLFAQITIQIACGIIGKYLVIHHNDEASKEKKSFGAVQSYKGMWEYCKRFPVSRAETAVTSVTEADGSQAAHIVLDGGMGIKVTLSTFGSRIISVISPDRHGGPKECLPEIPAQSAAAGSLCGAVLDVSAGGVRYDPAAQFLGLRVWEYTLLEDGGVSMRLACPQSGTQYEILYRLFGNRLRIEYRGSAIASRPVSLTHAFCFHAMDDDSVIQFSDTLRIPAATVLSADVPAPVPVAGNPMDFRRPRELTTILLGEHGFRHFFAFGNGGMDPPAPRAVLETPDGRSVTVSSTDSGLWLGSGANAEAALNMKGAVRENSFLLLAPIPAPAVPMKETAPGAEYHKITDCELGFGSWSA